MTTTATMIDDDDDDWRPTRPGGRAKGGAGPEAKVQLRRRCRSAESWQAQFLQNLSSACSGGGGKRGAADELAQFKSCIYLHCGPLSALIQ
jgi:hypothetical protein